MIESLSGELLDKAPGHAVVECHGVGYLVYMPLSAMQATPEKGHVRLHIHYSVSVDVRSGQSEHRLFGFLRPADRELFRQLITVQGVSASIGMALMGSASSDELRNAIMSGDVARLKGVKGVGPKLAQRIVTDLSARLVHGGAATIAGIPQQGNTLKSEALSALVSLGLDRIKAERTLQGVLKEYQGEDPSLEELIKLTLKRS